MSPSVTPMCCGSLTMDADVLVAGRSGRIEAPSTTFLIETADRTILVDTSFGPPDLMTERHPGFECRRSADRTLRAALEAEGAAPSDVDAIVFSHLDWDHCYNLELFNEDVPIYVQRRELQYAIAPYPMHAVRYEAKSLGREPPWLSRDLTPIEGETELAPGVTAFPTPGHTVGHQSLAVETDAGTTVIAADALPTFENVLEDGPAPFRRGATMNDFEWWESAHDVSDRADRILPGHEWEILEANPVGSDRT
ncbi:N-acyl homoserine lactonase family protein [Halopenitus persicus]|uniref:Glyoxylase, beta-lactamase superfamily II n=1 Tax=Halopenitus persicus TaxID=1048396 RepID=A0A1H3GWK9_9EURY|nr:N-acyl homoserine lactonase family protein [Halopenitus persicus]SDY06894.1 Glyoxylase, beta-lactamase superfamily II [Halopenitus persicus]